MKAVAFLTIIACAFAQRMSQMPQTGFSSADVKLLSEYRLTMDNVTKMALAAKSLNQTVANDPSLAKNLQGNGNQSLETFIQRLNESPPKVITSITGAGLSTHDYVLTLTALLLSEKGNRLREQGKLHALIPGMSAENLKFVATHKPQIKSLMTAVSRKPERKAL
ncbi:MAG: hypothetical protein M3Z23_00785 [Acidobacteriota bacterium]|nr:hypothetical protein [Acidobacteriota bacterium]